MKLYGQNAKALLRSSSIFQGRSVHIDKRLGVVLRKIAEGRSKQLAKGYAYDEVVDHLHRADWVAFAAKVDKLHSRMRLAAMMARNITEHRQMFQTEHVPITFSLVDHKKDYRQTLRRYNKASKTVAPGDVKN
jgi:hypothetical protein